MGFLQDFWAFNVNAFYTITYFLFQNIFIILGLVCLAYSFVAEEVINHASDVRDESQIM